MSHHLAPHHRIAAHGDAGAAGLVTMGSNRPAIGAGTARGLLGMQSGAAH